MHFSRCFGGLKCLTEDDLSDAEVRETADEFADNVEKCLQEENKLTEGNDIEVVFTQRLPRDFERPKSKVTMEAVHSNDFVVMKMLDSADALRKAVVALGSWYTSDCYYYVIDHSSRQLLWLEEYNARRMAVQIGNVADITDLRACSTLSVK